MKGFYELRLLGAHRVLWLDGTCRLPTHRCNQVENPLSVLLPHQFLRQPVPVRHPHRSVPSRLIPSALQVRHLHSTRSEVQNELLQPDAHHSAESDSKPRLKLFKSSLPMLQG